MSAKQVWFVTAFAISLLMAAAWLKWVRPTAHRWPLGHERRGMEKAPRADSRNEAHEAIQRTYARMDAALNSKDVNTAYNFYTSDFVSISQKGERTSLEEGKNGLSQALTNPNLKSIKNMTTIEKFILEGDTATVFRKEMATVVVVNIQTGANDVGVVNSRCLDTWVKRNGRWLVKQGEAMSSVATINGNPVPQETQPGLAQQNIPPTMPLNPQQPGNEQSPLSKQTKNYKETPPEILHIPLPTERYFLFSSSDTAVVSGAFSYPSSWYVQTNPPGIYGNISALPPHVLEQMKQRFDIIFAPREDPRQATHHSVTTSLVQGIVNPQEALQRWISQRFSGFRITNSITPQSQGVPGSIEIQGINVSYEASFQGVPVEGLLGVTTLVDRDPLFGVSTLVDITEIQLAKNLSKEKYYEYEFVLVLIHLSQESNRVRTNESTAKGMINTLGGVAEARNPSTGEIFTIPYNYKYAYQKGNEAILTNDPSFKVPGATPLQIKSAHNR